MRLGRVDKRSSPFGVVLWTCLCDQRRWISRSPTMLKRLCTIAAKGEAMNTEAMSKEYQPFNMMEQVVESRLLEMMQKSKMCTCGKCCADVRAIVLNSLPPKYVVTRVGEAMLQYELMTPQMQAIVVSELMMAIEKVCRNPRHGS